MVRIGMLFGAGSKGETGSFHSNVWASILNGFDPARAQAEDWPQIGGDQPRIDGGRIVSLWDPDRERARRMARVYGIERACDSPEELADSVDAALFVEDGSFDKLPHIRPLLERGLPCYLDKPLAQRAEEAAEIVDLAHRHGAPLLSCSGWRFCDGAGYLREQMDQIGGAKLLIGIISMSSFDVYAIHGVEMALELIGSGVEEVTGIGREGARVACLRWSDGRQAVLHLYDRSIRAGRRFIIYGPDGPAETADLGEIHPPLLERFLEMCRTRESPLDNAEMIEAVEILERIREQP